ncbi:MAG TPA: thiamine phosphate synthase [Syntrophomonadaceae bacterium]|nr:thiamine phosphate synthase [Syntrophomonadaceae bacterium]
MEIDYSVYLVTDRRILQGRDLLDAVAEAIEGGVTLIQLREKEVSSREFYQIALKVKDLAHSRGVPLLINDRLDIALAVNADGLHIGQEDLPLKVARKLLGPDKIIGLSVSNLEDAVQGEKEGADYLGAGAVYPTTSKDVSESPIGPDGLKKIKDAVSIPVVGIGGINLFNIEEVKRTGVDGVAVISAIMGAPDIKDAARKLADAWRRS